MCISIDAPRFTGCTPAASNRTACRTVLRASPTSLPNQVAERVFCKATEWKPRELLLSCRVSWYTTNIRRTGLITPDRLGRLVTLKILLEASTSKTLIEACNFEAYIPFLSYPEHQRQLGDPLQAKPPPEIRSLTAEERTWHWREIQLPLLCKCSTSLLQTINCILRSPFPAGKPRSHRPPSICRIFYDPTSRNLTLDLT